MAQMLSKLLMSDYSFTYNCYELGHTWTPHCSQAAIDIGLFVFQEAVKIYAGLYLGTHLLSARRFQLCALQATAVNIFRSSAFLGFNAFSAIGAFCLIRRLCGRFYLPLFGHVPAIVASFLAIQLESKRRRPALAFYVTNMAVESIFNLLQAKGILRSSDAGTVLLFTLTIALLMYLIKKNEYGNDFISLTVKSILGGQEARSGPMRAGTGTGSGNPAAEAALTASTWTGESSTVSANIFDGPNHRLSLVKMDDDGSHDNNRIATVSNRPSATASTTDHYGTTCTGSENHQEDGHGAASVGNDDGGDGDHGYDDRQDALHFHPEDNAQGDQARIQLRTCCATSAPHVKRKLIACAGNDTSSKQQAVALMCSTSNDCRCNNKPTNVADDDDGNDDDDLAGTDDGVDDGRDCNGCNVMKKDYLDSGCGHDYYSIGSYTIDSGSSRGSSFSGSNTTTSDSHGDHIVIPDDNQEEEEDDDDDDEHRGSDKDDDGVDGNRVYRQLRWRQRRVDDQTGQGFISAAVRIDEKKKNKKIKTMQAVDQHTDITDYATSSRSAVKMAGNLAPTLMAQQSDKTFNADIMTSTLVGHRFARNCSTRSQRRISSDENLCSSTCSSLAGMTMMSRHKRVIVSPDKLNKPENGGSTTSAGNNIAKTQAWSLGLQLTDQRHHATCPHGNQSCLRYALSGFLRPALLGTLMHGAFMLLMRMRRASFSDLMASPLVELRRVLTTAASSSSSNSSRSLFSRDGNKSLRFGCFLGAFTGTFRACNCALRWFYGEDRDYFRFLAGLAAGPAMCIYPQGTITQYLLWKCIEMLYFAGVRAGLVTRVDFTMSLLYALGCSQLFFACIVSPAIIRPSYLRFLLRVTNNYLSLVNRNIIDMLGTRSSAGFCITYPSLDLEYTSRKFRESVLVWLL